MCIYRARNIHQSIGSTQQTESTADNVYCDNENSTNVVELIVSLQTTPEKTASILRVHQHSYGKNRFSLRR